MTEATPADAPDGQSEVMAISSAVVRLYKEQLGRGPTKAHTHYAGRNIIVVSLEKTMVPAERKLVGMGEARRMAESRLVTMEGAAPEFCEAIEQITGRKVRAMVCGMSAEADISTKVFYLEPEGL
jgi:uncharacterized protein YbcI